LRSYFTINDLTYFIAVKYNLRFSELKHDLGSSAAVKHNLEFYAALTYNLGFCAAVSVSCIIPQ
jgi:hypothetical protein